MSSPIRLPAIISIPQRDSFTDGFEFANLRTQFEIGAPRSRRMRTLAPRLFSVTFVCDAQQFQEWEYFYQDTIKGGSLPFDILLLDDDNSYVWFTVNTVGDYTYNNVGTAYDRWNVVVALRSKYPSFSTRDPGTSELGGLASVGADIFGGLHIPYVMKGLSSIDVLLEGKIASDPMRGLITIDTFASSQLQSQPPAGLITLDTILSGRLQTKNMFGLIGVDVEPTGFLNSSTTLVYRYWRLNITKARTANNLRPPNDGVIRVSGLRLKQGATYYPLSAMTSNTAPPPLVASASTTSGSGSEAFRAFDGSIADVNWWSSTSPSTSNSWLQIDLGSGNGIFPTNFEVATDGSTSTGSWPVDFALLASNTGSFTGEEFTYASITGRTNWNANTYQPFGQKRMESYLTGMTCAYALKQIIGTYIGPLICVRRSSDSTEMDIGFMSDGTLDTTTLSTFVGSSDGLVSKWYDQILVQDAVQTTTTKQPKIVSAGTVLSHITFDGVDDYLITHTGASSVITIAARVALPTAPTGSGVAVYFAHANSNTVGYNTLLCQYQADDAKLDTYVFTGNGNLSQRRSTFSTALQSNVWICDRTSYPPQLYTNGVFNAIDMNVVGTPGAGNFSDSDLYIGSMAGSEAGVFQYDEFVIWNINQSANAIDISNSL